MFGFSRRRIRLGRTKVQLGDSAQGLRSPVRHTKRPIRSSGENAASAKTRSRELKSGGLDAQSVPEVNCSNNYASGNFKNWVELSTSGEKPAPRFSHAATVIGSKMVVVGGDSGHGLLDDVQILDFNRLVWSTTKAVPKGHFSPSSLPSKVPPCKGHCLVSWGEKVLLVGGKSNPAFERVSVWSFDIETECWSRVEAKGDIPVARSGHSVTRSGSVLILFGGEDSKGRKLNDLHMFDLKTFMWLPLHYTGTGPSPRSNHVAALYNDRMLIIFGGAAKSKILNDLYSLDFETMVWSRLKTHGFHPSPRSGCCGVLYGSKWYITGGGSKKKRYAETWVFNVLKVEWSVVATQPSSSVTTNKGISLVFVQHKEKSFFVAFGGNKKEVSNQVEIFLVEQGRQPISENAAPERGLRSLDNCAKLTTEYSNRVTPSCPIDNIAKQKLKSALEQNGTSRKSLSEASIDQTSGTANVSLRKQFHQEEECSLQMKMQKDLEEDRIREHEDHMVSSNPSLQSQKTKPLDCMFQVTSAKSVISTEPDSAFIFDNENNTRDYHKQSHLNASSEEDGALLEEFDEKTGISNACQLYEAKLMATLRKNSSLEGQLSAALASREAMEKYLSTVMKSRQEMERKLVDSLRDIDLLKEKLASSELAQEEVNSLSNIVHSDNVRLEHDVAFLKAVLDDTQKELHSTRGVLAGERARAFQLQVEVFHLKQRLQTMENRTPTPRKPLNA